jgi:transposase-like protein
MPLIGCIPRKPLANRFELSHEGAKFWIKAMNALRDRGMQDVSIAVVNELMGLPEAITAIFPQAPVQTCTVPCQIT